MLLLATKKLLLYKSCSTPAVTKSARLYKSSSQELPGPSNTVNCEEFNHWLAGLIDGDGCFYLNKGKYPGCRVVSHEREIDTLYLAKERFGGSVRRDSARDGVAAKCFTWQLSGRTKMVALLTAMNGKIITPKRYGQFVLLCTAVGIMPEPGVVSRDSSWLAGLFDADGSVNVDRDTSLHLSISQVDGAVLTPFIPLWGGKVVVYDNRNLHQWILGSTGPDLGLFANYLVKNSRSLQKLRQLKVLRSIICLRGAVPVDKKAIHEVVNAFWVTKDRER